MKPLICIVGKSASGKTTVAEILETQRGLKSLQSYTTRPKRHENETGHIFISDKEFDALQDIIAYTEYNGFKYCATKEQIDDVDIYVIDPPGLDILLQKYQTDRPIMVFYFEANICTRIDRMIERGDSDAAIVSRIYTDDAFDWKARLIKIAYNHPSKKIVWKLINANLDINDVLTQVNSKIDRGGLKK